MFWNNKNNLKSESKIVWFWSLMGASLAFLGSIPFFIGRNGKKSESHKKKPESQKKKPGKLFGLLSLVLILVIILALILWFIFNRS